jgi:hypothetical protein
MSWRGRSSAAAKRRERRDVSTPPDDHRIRLTLRARVVTALGTRDVTVQTLSAYGAQIATPSPLGFTGRTIELHLPAANGETLTLTAGIGKVERVAPGELVSLHFIVPDGAARGSINRLLTHLLGGDGGGTRRHPRVIYDTRVRFGDNGEFFGRLEEISLGGAGLRVAMALAEGLPFVLLVPSLLGSEELRLSARVVNQRRASDGGFRTGVAFEPLSPELHARLGKLLADLMQR